MRVTVVHSFYSSSSPSGETSAVLQHVAALRRAGHDVVLERLETDVLQRRPLYGARAAIRVASGRGPAPDIGATRPDIVHVHNLFPNYGTSWLATVGAPVVATLHNYRALCASANFFRDGAVCTDCLDRRARWPSVVHGCYRSRPATVPMALRPWFDRDPVLRRADRLIVLSSRMQELYRTAGVPEDRLRLIPNFMPADEDGGLGPGGDRWLYVGRITPEKGLLDVLRHWPADIGLDVVGSGPDEEAARLVAPRDVRFLGNLPRARVQERLRAARGLLFPSRWFEGSPMVYPEALAAGTPILAFDPSSVASAVRDDETGFVGGVDLRTEVERAHLHFPLMRRRCRSVFEAKYAEGPWITALQQVYEESVRRTR